MRTRRLCVLLILLATGALLLSPLAAAAQTLLTPRVNYLDARAGAASAVTNVEGRSKTPAKEVGLPGWFDGPTAFLLRLFLSLNAIIINLVHVLLNFIAKVLNVILGVTHYASVGIIVQGWKFVRDILNFVFAFVLLAIAFSTIAGLETFQARQLLPRLLIAALLFNFSLGIGGAINGVATCIMNTAISTLKVGGPGGGAGGSPGRGTLISGKGATSQSGTKSICGGRPDLGDRLVTAVMNSASIGKYTQFGPTTLQEFAGGPASNMQKSDALQVVEQDIKSYTSYFLGGLSALLFTLMFFAAMVALTILFFVRITVLLILLVLSPIPYALGVVPGAAGYARQWWEQFLKYVTFGPVTIILIVLVVNLLDNRSGQQTLLTDLGVSNATFGKSQLGKEVAEAGFFTMFIASWLAMAIMVGLKFGVIGAGMATSLGGRVARGAAYYGSGAGLAAAGGRALWRQTGEPFMAAREEQRKAATRARREGPFGRLGRETVGTPLGRPGEQMLRRQEDEEVKDLAARGATQKDLTLSEASHARYALEKGLISGKPGTEEQGFYETALNAVPLNSEAFNRGAKAYQERYVVAGTNFVTLKRTGAAATASDHEKTLQGLSDADAYNAYTRELSLRADISAHRIRASRNLARGVANAGDVPAGRMIALAAGPGTAKENPAVIKELEDRKIV